MSIVAFCNPLLDITVHLETPEQKSLLTRYGLRGNDIILGSDVHAPLLPEIFAMFNEDEIEFGAGGAGLNSMRIAQRALPPNSTCIVGCIGEEAEEFGDILVERTVADGVASQSFIRIPGRETGRCACLIHDEHRSLVAFPDAGNALVPEMIDFPQVQAAIVSASLVYVTGFFVASCPDAAAKVLQIAKAAGKVTVFNFSAGFVGRCFRQVLMEKVFSVVDWIIGNMDEVRELYGHEHEATDINLVKRLTESFPKASVIVTNGSAPLLFASPTQSPLLQTQRQVHVQAIPVPQIAANEIVDTNGAGDAFAAGILAALAQGQCINPTGIELGCKLAGQVIRLAGIQLPPWPQ